MILQQELLVRIVTVLSQANPDFVRADVKACDNASEELPDLLKVIKADAGRAIDQEDDVGHGGFGTFWTGERQNSVCAIH